MKKMMIVSAFALLLSAGAHAQVPVVGTITGTVELGSMTQMIMEKTQMENVLYYIMMVEQQVQSVFNTYYQLQNMIRAEERALKNLEGIASVGSYSDLMSWYNRQLYLERQVEERYQNIGVQIGSKNYRISEIEEIPGALRDRFASDEYWDDFSEEQRREMWMRLGLTPSNYIYQTAWLENERSLARRILTRLDTVNEENQDAFMQNDEILNMTINGEVAEKGILQGILQVAVDTNRAIREANYDAAEWREYQLSLERLKNVPQGRPGLSDIWGAELFTGRISEMEGEFIDRY
jgi:prefoldin subunit 5